MEALNAILAMGGYAGFVWPAYGLTFVVLAGVLVASWRGMRASESELEAAQRLRPSRRARAAKAQAQAEAQGGNQA